MILLSEEQLLEKLKYGEKLSYSERRRFDALMESKFKPEEDKDFFIKKLKEYTVSLDVHVRLDVNGEEPDETDIVLKAIEAVRKGHGDADGDVVYEETIKKYEVDAKGKPFYETAWRYAKVKEYLKEILPKRPWEVVRPLTEKSILVFC